MSYVDVNFNVNKNIDNRYSLVSYKIITRWYSGNFRLSKQSLQRSAYISTGTGKFQSAIGIRPTNCPWEVYWVKGCVVRTFMASGTQDLILGPTGNPYRTSG